MLLLLLSAACHRAPVDTDGGDPDDTDLVDTDTGEELGEAAFTADVIVIGSGPTGLSAAYAAVEAGRDVVVLERDDAPGGAGWWAGNYYAVDTRFMRAEGLEDSIALAEEEWPTWSGGGDGQDPRVQLLLSRSAEVVEWIVDGLGAELGPITNDLGMPGLPRVHTIAGESGGPTGKLVEQLGDRITLGQEAVDVLFDAEGRTRGVSYRDVASGELRWGSAEAVVVATGGFARDLDRVLQDRPELAGMELVVEIAYTSDGGGIDLMERAGAQWQNPGAYGMYTHAVADYREPFPGEALWVGGLQHAVLLDGEGRRFTNEEKMFGFALAGMVAEVPGRRVFAVLPERDYFANPVIVPAYQRDLGSELMIDPQELVDAGAVDRYQTPEALGEGLGMDPTLVRETFDRYEELVLLGEDLDQRKPREALRPFTGTDYLAFEIHVGAAKAFTGFSVDVDGRVLDGAGQAVPGLYAGGEVTGMLGTPGAGIGFTGSITACYLTGLVAGEQAAAWTAP